MRPGSILMAATFLVLSASIARSEEAVRVLAVRGLDPIDLGEGKEVAGSEKIVSTHGRFEYRFASEEHKKAFESEPERFGIQWGGGCGRMGPLSGMGSAERFAVHDGRIFIFASDGCRAAFLKDPTAYFWNDSPELPADGDVEGGKQRFERMLAAMGGGDKLSALRSYSEVLTYEQPDADKTAVVKQTFELDTRRGVRMASSWNASEWGTVMSRAGAFATSTTSSSYDLVAAQTREFERVVHHTLLAIVLSRARPDFVVQYGGKVTEGDVESDLLRIRFDGLTTDLLLDGSTALPRSLRYRGRYQSGRVGDVRVDLADWREVAGLRFPHARAVSFNGKVLDDGKLVSAVIQIDSPIPAEHFTR